MMECSEYTSHNPAKYTIQVNDKSISLKSGEPYEKGHHSIKLWKIPPLYSQNMKYISRCFNKLPCTDYIQLYLPDDSRELSLFNAILLTRVISRVHIPVDYGKNNG